MKKSDQALLLATSMALFSGMGMPMADDPLRGIDLRKEWELIQQKKSKLSSRLRKMVELRIRQIEFHND